MGFEGDRTRPKVKKYREWQEVKRQEKEWIEKTSRSAEHDGIYYTDAETRLTKDVADACETLRKKEGRYLVDAYYQTQGIRKAQVSRVCQMEEEPNRLLIWSAVAMERLESLHRRALHRFADKYAVGRWCQSIVGIGPVITSGFLSYFDIRRAPCAHQFWGLAGLDPTAEWKKGEERPWIAKLKTLCAFKLGESFIKQQNRDGCFYGQMAIARKKKLVALNEAKKLKHLADKELENPSPKRQASKRWKLWQQGYVAQQHCHDMARRWAVKLFLSHLHHVMYVDFFECEPPRPFVFERPDVCGKHTHFIPPYNWEKGKFDGAGLRELYAGSERK